ncbi:MAG: aminoglycoside 3'-phosphotransferase [Ruminococcaceae bacterium]|nr:aminoglycoside 3'-phosphotransferase [Oscillospiraceae bacterium]
MERTLIQADLSAIPPIFHPYFRHAAVFDSSCSRAARVLFLDQGPGFYLKSAPKGTLLREAALTRFFHSLGMATEVLAYESLEQDWMLTLKVPGEDCLDARYTGDPLRLCDTTAELLRRLHSAPTDGCPVPDRTAEYLSAARRCWESRSYSTEHFPDNWGYDTPENAWKVIEERAHLLRSDTLLHGDYCLPNIMLNDWRFSAFIDLDAGGVGDRHIDLFWGIWSLEFNLKTDRYRDRFLDVYGRDVICEDIFPLIAACEVFG